MTPMTSLSAVLMTVYFDPIAIQSDFARERALEVSTLASMGLISNRTTHSDFDRKWRVTGLGLDALKELDML